MKRRLSVLLAVITIFTFTSCDTQGVKTDAVIGVAEDTPSSFAIDEFLTDGVSFVKYSTFSEVVLALENGKIDYAVMNDFEIRDAQNSGAELEKVQTAVTTAESYIYFDKGNTELRDAFNSVIKTLSSNGTLEEIKRCHLDGEKYETDYSEDDSDNELIMVCDPSFPDRIYTSDTGEIYGTDVDIAREICCLLDCTLKITTVDFDEVFTALDNGDADFVMTAAEKTDERCKNYICSDSYFTLNFHLVKRKSV